MTVKLYRLLLPCMMFICLHGFAQTEADQKKKDLHAQLKNMIDAKQYRFRPMSATSQRGRTVQLGTEYSLKVKNDSLSVDLPYYGRSYMVSYPATDLSNRFVTDQFSYVSDTTKKNGWEITILPKNQPKASKIFIAIGSGGYCTVQITSSSRDPISYYGEIVPYNY